MSGSVVLVARYNDSMIGSRLVSYQAANSIIQFMTKHLNNIKIFINYGSKEININDVTLYTITSPKIIYSYDDFVSSGFISPGLVINDIIKILLNYYIENYKVTIPSIDSIIESKSMIEITNYFNTDGPVMAKMSQYNFTNDITGKNIKLTDKTRLDLNLMFNYYILAIKDRKIYNYSKYKLDPINSYELLPPRCDEDKYLIYTDLNNLIIVSNHDIYYSCFVLHRSDNCIIHLSQRSYTLQDVLHQIRLCFNNSSIFSHIHQLHDDIVWYKPKSWKQLPHGYHLSGISSELLILSGDTTLMTRGFYTYYYYKLTPDSDRFSGYSRAINVDQVRKHLDTYYFMPWQHTVTIED